jgi:membrane associated rhomboid family serine protease
MAVCYRHPSRETGVSCSSCGRPICPDCMTPTPVGMRCPECSRERTKVRTARSIGSSTGPVATYTLIAINVIVFLAEGGTGASLGAGGGGTVFEKGALFGPLIAHQHEYWRLVSAGFLHDGFIHLLFNMVFIYFMGPALEQMIGRVGFVVIYFTSLLAGSFGALLVQPMSPTVGASGAAFGLLGALIVVAHSRRIPIWQSGLGITLAINVVFSLSFAQISVGAHIGGLIAGLICGWLFVEFGERRRMPAAAIGLSVALAVASVAGAIAVAGGTGLAPNGIGLGG